MRKLLIITTLLFTLLISLPVVTEAQNRYGRRYNRYTRPCVYRVYGGQLYRDCSYVRPRYNYPTYHYYRRNRSYQRRYYPIVYRDNYYWRNRRY